ncbi:phosphotransferase family protein [Nonomuraea zeae]|uniref:Aminoglycoside phosphotransferase family protein n=2 Tax=Nonomuraea zeae TaxID=1642303 RepID=A0A5S4GXB1_9ACTN|nr:aminoglycoside phosphotransferase family protein [Nonomuraea zeae]TMR37467.1 aminoglycoside phosphotransferase family protein [Nonomuraea zeae]
MGRQRGPGLDEPLRAWLEGRLGGRTAVSAVRSLHGGESPWWVDLTAPGGSAYSAVLRSPSSRIGPDQIATNAAALAVAEQHGLPAPRLLAADLDGREAGTAASLETVVPGTSTWPDAPSTELLLAAGAAIARVHAVTLDPQPQLPFRPRPIAVDDFARDRRAGKMPTTALLQLADERVQAIKAPDLPVVFVHGDVWPGNTVIGGGAVRGLIDWKTAGVGNPGVDLGELRKQVAIRYDDDAPGHVLEGWERAGGTLAGDIAYWDAVAVLNTPTEEYSPYATFRRDHFLRAAIARL